MYRGKIRLTPKLPFELCLTCLSVAVSKFTLLNHQEFIYLGSHEAHASLELCLKPRMTLDKSYLYRQSAVEATVPGCK